MDLHLFKGEKIMFYGQCNTCGQRWELGTASTCTCKKEIPSPFVKPINYADAKQLYINPSNYENKTMFHQNKTTNWATVDRDNKLVHLDMDLCAEGPANVYTALAIGVWNAAIEAAANNFEIEDGYYYDEVKESILRNKK
jgi:hypothetical protein